MHQRTAPEVLIYANGKLMQQASAEIIEDGCGSGALPRAQIAMRITEPTERANLRIGNQEVEIVFRRTMPVTGEEPEDERQGERVVFWGRLSGGKIKIGPNESVFLEARVAPYHFGKPLDGMVEYNPSTSSHQILKQDLEFNPTVNFSGYGGKRLPGMRSAGGFIRGNMSSVYPYGDKKANVFLDPASVYSDAARKYSQGTSPQKPEGDESVLFASDKKWTLKEAIYYLCVTLNESEKFIKNPSREDLSILDGSDALLHDVRVPIGTFLPEALDSILNQFGFGWRLDYLSRGKRTIAIFRRGLGIERKLNLQRPGQALIPAKTNTESCELAVGMESIINEVRILGNFALYEATFELKRAWPKDKDNLNRATDLRMDSKEWKEHPEYHRVWRDWVLNEANDYFRVRDERAPFNFAEIFEFPTVPRRRRFLPCITLDKDRIPIGQNGYFIEFHNGFEWLPINRMENGSFEILQNECGIRFTGDMPPAELMFAGTNAKVRITASVYSDERLDYTAKRRRGSAQDQVAPLTLDLGDRFHYRKIHKSSQFHKRVKAKELDHSEVFDTRRMVELADRLRDSRDLMDVSGTVVIPNLDEIYELGSVMRRMGGRDIDFDVGASAGPRYPQVTARRIDIRQQKQFLTLETLRDVRLR